MRSRKILIGLGILIFALVFFSLYQLSNFTLFDNEFEVIESIKVPDKDYILKIYHIPSNATSQSYIQIRKIENGIEDVLENYERFNHLENYALARDTLVLSVRDLGNAKAEIVIKKIPLP
ncbi:MAG: hypothetical protein SFV55_29930 [Haliscomenobacter sp.]|uniref:hypothetical protein n=1 Tax=Haliscomenobacter sp. TaxID=2717303 RepID=UPI0029B311EB|nr:hypothetical protein [Haliscomenobacter sp.]MDX2072692.1 hypothetical protein [Haliscomenobacter sp.]